MKQINNNVEETRVGFTNAKLLKDAGFDVFCEDVFVEYFKTTEYNEKGIKYESRSILKGRNSFNEKGEYYEIFSAPTQQLAIDWIRINFNLFIEIHLHLYCDFWYSILNINTPIGTLLNTSSDEYFDTPEEAKDAAIKYVLENLIK